MAILLLMSEAKTAAGSFPNPMSILALLVYHSISSWLVCPALTIPIGQPSLMIIMRLLARCLFPPLKPLTGAGQCPCDSTLTRKPSS